MGKNLFLADLKNLTEQEIKEHIANEYCKLGGDEYSSYERNRENFAYINDELRQYDIIIAYESVGSWGCDSTSYFLMQHKLTNEYQEFSGSHCSCYGFEGQYSPEPVTLEYLKSDIFYFHCGGYDEQETENQEAVKKFLSELED